MNRHNHQLIGLIATAIFVYAFAASASAAIISVNFVGGSVEPPNANRGGVVVNALSPTDTTGVVSADNWNNAGIANDVTQVPAGGNEAGNIADLNDDSGAATGASLDWQSNNTWSGVVAETGPDQYLMKGFLDTSNTSTTTAVITDIPYATYDVYVYVEGSNAAGRIGQYRLFDGSGTGGSQLGEVFRIEDAPYFDGTFDQATGASAGTATAGDYVLFQGISASTLTIAATPAGSSDANFRAPLTAFQIVDTTVATVPTPAALPAGFAMIGLTVCRLHRRRHK